MNDIETILQTERQQHHVLDNPDLLAFATLTQIAHEESQALSRKRFRIGIVLCLLISLAAFQTVALNGLSYTAFSDLISDIIERHPFALSALNCALVGSILVARRLRLI